MKKTFLLMLLLFILTSCTKNITTIELEESTSQLIYERLKNKNNFQYSLEIYNSNNLSEIIHYEFLTENNKYITSITHNKEQKIYTWEENRTKIFEYNHENGQQQTKYIEQLEDEYKSNYLIYLNLEIDFSKAIYKCIKKTSLMSVSNTIHTFILKQITLLSLII